MKKKVALFSLSFFLITSIVCFVTPQIVTVRASKNDIVLDTSVSWQGAFYNGSYEGSVSNGVPAGTGIFEGEVTDNDGIKDGIFYKGKWKNGKFHGKGRLEDYGKGLVYEGKFKNGMLNGSIKIYSIENEQMYTLVKYKEDVPYNISWSCDAEGNYLDYDCYYRGISVKKIQQESKNMDYGDLVYNEEQNLYQKIQLYCRVESQTDVSNTSNREVIVSDENGNSYLLQYDVAYDTVAMNYMPFLENGQEITVYGYYIGLKNSVMSGSILYPCIQAVSAEKENGDKFDVENMDFQYDSFLNYPYQYENKNIELEGVIKGIYKQTKKELFYLLESKNYGNGVSHMYVCCVSKKKLKANEILAEGDMVSFTGKMKLLLKYSQNEELNTFAPFIDSVEIVEE